MIITIVESEIYSPISKVYDYVSNLESMVDYNYSVKNAKWVSQDKNNLICKITISLSILNFTEDYKVTELIENKKIVAKCDFSTLEFEDSYFFSESSKGTILRIEDKMKLKGLLSFSEGILRPVLKSDMERNLQKLKSILES
jgi:hypothetical protein